MARRPVADKLDGVKVTCDHCVAVASSPFYHLAAARGYIAAKWGWIVAPNGADLCHVCAKRGEHLRPPYSVCPPTPPSLAIPEGVLPIPQRKAKPRKVPPPKPKAKAKK